MKSLTICHVTSRLEPKRQWFLDSLRSQIKRKDESEIRIIFIDLHATGQSVLANNALMTPPKPTVWQGKHRVTKDNWWAASNARNTGICLCKTDWIAFLDDRSVLMPGWLPGIKSAMKEGYAVCGAYQKRTGMTVENGVIKHGGIVIGEDTREDYLKKHALPIPYAAPGQWWFGCTNALPLEWALAINGWSERCDSLSMEDVIFGLHLANSSFPIKYDPRMKIIEDRTPEQLGEPMKRTDKGHSPVDKSHKLLADLGSLKASPDAPDIRKLREHVLNGGEFPIPTEPTHDWYDNQPVKDF